MKLSISTNDAILKDNAGWGGGGVVSGGMVIWTSMIYNTEWRT